MRAFLTKRPLATCIAVLALLCAWLFSASLFSGKVLAPEDIVVYNGWPYDAPASLTHPANSLLFDPAWVLHPDMLEARRQLRDFHLPTWSPMLGAGQPLLASQQNAALFPLNWIADVFPFWQSLEWVAALKVFLAALGMLLLLRALRLRHPAALLGAITYGFSMTLVLWLEHPHSNAYAVLPWVVLGVEAVLIRGGPRPAAGYALAVGLAMLSGQPESAFLVMVAALVYALARLVSLGDRGLALRRIGWLAAGTVAGTALGAVMLIPFQEMLGQATDSSRSTGPGPRAMALSLFMPELWGRPDKFVAAAGPINFQERTAYFGAIPFMLAIGGLVARRRAPQVGFALVFFIGFALAVDTPLVSDLLATLPGLDQISRLRGLILCAFGAAGLAAYGLDVLLTGDARARRLLVAGAVVAAAPPLVWLAFHTEVPSNIGRTLDQLPVQGRVSTGVPELEFATVLRWCAIAAAAIAALVVAARRPQAAGAIAAVLVAITAADLVTLDRGYHPALPLALADPPTPAPVEYARKDLGHYRIAGGNEFGPDLAARYAVRDARIHALPALTRRNDVWFGLGGDGYLQRHWISLGDNRLASLVGARYAFLRSLNQDPTGQWARTPYSYLYENRFALPRAWIAYDWTPASGKPAALKAMGASDSRGDFQKPVIETDQKPSGARESGFADFTSDGDTTVSLAVEAAAPGFVILNDTYYPGWKAEVDGKEAPIRPANVWFRAVHVPAGSHTVKFVYRPASVVVGLVVSTLAAIVIAAGLVVPWRRRP